MEFDNNFGKCEVICHLMDVAIIKLENNFEKYVVTIGLSIPSKKWERGYYCNSFKVASEIFNKIIEDFYMATFKI